MNETQLATSNALDHLFVEGCYFHCLCNKQVTRQAIYVWSNTEVRFCDLLLQWKIDKNYSWFQNIVLFWMLYSLFWVIPRRLNFMSRLFGTPCSMDGTESSETSAYEIQIMGNHPKERIKTNITYSECVFVALFIQHAMLMLQTAICGLPVLRIVFPLSRTRHDFRKKNYWM